jgi:hypothetical protein
MTALRILRNLAVLVILAVGGLSVTNGWATAASQPVTCSRGYFYCGPHGISRCCKNGEHCCVGLHNAPFCCVKGCCGIVCCT